MSISNLQLICNLLCVVPIGSGRFTSSVNFAHTPAGTGGLMTIGNSAGQVSDIYNNDPQAVPSSGSALSFTLSSLLDPAGGADGFQHVSHLLFENLSTVQTLTLKPGASNPVSWGTLPTAGIALPPSVSAQQTSFVLIAVPAGLAVASGTADRIQV